MKRYSVDFEATTNELYEQEGLVRVWAWQIRDIDTLAVAAQGNTIDTFMDWTTSLKESVNYYIHNLKYDGNFIIDYLLRNGWEHLGDDETPRSNTFETLITNMGAYFSITINLAVYSTRTVRITMYDSLKKLPMSLERIAHAFKLPILKGDIDYHKFRSIDHVMDAEEQKYMDADTEILARALGIQFNSGLEKMTIASDALNHFKSTIATGKGKVDNQFEYLYPKLPREMDDYIRASYKGGFVYLKPEYSGRTFDRTISYDVNSLYPSVMYNNILPFGVPQAFEGQGVADNRFPLFIQHLEVSFTLKEGYLPTIQAKGNMRFVPTEYLHSSEGEIIELYLTNIDLEMFLEHHDIHYIEYLGGLKFRGVKNQFKTYIDHWSHIKETSEGGKRELAKLMLNSLYGKFATKLEKVRKIPYLCELTDKVRFNYSDEVIGEPIYTAMSSFITAYARKITIGAAQDNYDRFIYADTDSIHLIGHDVPDNLDIHDSTLGKWGHEGNFGKSKFLRAKTYLKENEKSELLITCAGLPDDARTQITFDNFKIGAVYEGKLSTNVVKGGSLLRPSQFSIMG